MVSSWDVALEYYRAPPMGKIRHFKTINCELTITVFSGNHVPICICYYMHYVVCGCCDVKLTILNHYVIVAMSILGLNSK